MTFQAEKRYFRQDSACGRWVSFFALTARNPALVATIDRQECEVAFHGSIVRADCLLEMAACLHEPKREPPETPGFESVEATRDRINAPIASPFITDPDSSAPLYVLGRLVSGETSVSAHRSSTSLGDLARLSPPHIAYKGRLYALSLFRCQSGRDTMIAVWSADEARWKPTVPATETEVKAIDDADLTRRMSARAMIQDAATPPGLYVVGGKDGSFAAGPLPTLAEILKLGAPGRPDDMIYCVSDTVPPGGPRLRPVAVWLPGTGHWHSAVDATITERRIIAAQMGD